jgi:hypothetical protein
MERCSQLLGERSERGISPFRAGEVHRLDDVGGILDAEVVLVDNGDCRLPRRRLGTGAVARLSHLPDLAIDRLDHLGREFEIRLNGERGRLPGEQFGDVTPTEGEGLQRFTPIGRLECFLERLAGGDPRQQLQGVEEVALPGSIGPKQDDQRAEVHLDVRQ